MKKKTGQLGIPSAGGQGGDKPRPPSGGIRVRQGKHVTKSQIPVPKAPTGPDSAAAEARESARSSSHARREVGAEIGRNRRRGTPLALKFCLAITALIVLVTFLFGVVVISMFRKKIFNEILSSGEQQTLVLAALSGMPAGEIIDRDGKLSQDGDKLQEKYSRYLKTLSADEDARVLDAAVLSARMVHIFSMHNAVIAGKLQPPKPGSPELLQGDYPSVTKWKGPFAREGPEKPAIFFRAPLQGGDGHAYLILSTEEIDREVLSLMQRTAAFGAVFLVCGILLSLYLASRITHPINLLVRDMDIVARGDLDHEARPHSQDEIGLLAIEFNRMTSSLRDAQTRQRETDRLNSQVEIAEEVQARLLPAKRPSFPGYDVDAMYVSANELSGDYYDLIPADGTHLALVAADVSGKGIGAAMVMANSRAVMRMVAVGNLSAADVLAKVNAVLHPDIKRGMFITVFYALLDVPNRELTVSSAGHDPMIVYRASTGKVETINPNCPAIGILPGPPFYKLVREQKIKLYKGDRIVLYTDGVNEAMDEQNEQWGFERLFDFVAKNSELRSKDFLKQLLRALREHQGKAEQHDDVTVITFRVE